jgi:polysaccharide deacetylase 2 family uncharacterized protein YibQ
LFFPLNYDILSWIEGQRLVKNSEKKSPAVKRAKKSSGIKKNRRKKLVLKDGISAALIAAVLIGIAAVVTLSLIMANSVATDELADSPSSVDVSPESEISKPETVLIENPPEKMPETIGKIAPEVSVSKPEEKPLQTLPAQIPLHKGTIALVMDDAGNNLHELDAFLAFPGNLTIAVLPGLPYSAEAARRIRAAGKEVILHQPMEAIGGQNPGPEAISTNMTDAEIRAIIEKNLAEIGQVAGMNNHQGSKVTMDERVMEIILTICHDKGIYFLDSRTTADTVAPLIAGRKGTKIWERDVFLDNIQERSAMIRSFHDGLQKAEKKGGAIMIGHVWSSELAATLEELYPELIEQGFSLSTISKIMMGSIDYDDFWD